MTREEFLNLKEGDAVVCNKDYIPHSHESHYSKGHIYIVRKIVDFRLKSDFLNWDGTILTTSDNQGRTNNGWCAFNFDPYNHKKLEEYM